MTDSENMSRSRGVLHKFRFGSFFYSHILNFVFIIYAFLLPFSKAFPVFTGPYVIFLFWILEGGLRKKFEKIKSNKVVCYLVLFFIFNILSLFWSDNIHEGKQQLRYYFAMTVVCIAIYTSLKEKYAKSVMYAFLSAMFISEIASYGVFFNWWQIQGASPSNPTPFMHHTIYSVFLAITIFLLLAQIQDKSTPLKLRALEIIFFLSSSINLFINGGRTGQIAFILGAFAYTVVYFKRKIFLLYTFVGLALVLIGAYQLSPNFNNRVHQAMHDVEKIWYGNLNSSWGSRIAMKKVALNMIENQPIVGVGIGDAMGVFRESLKDEEFRNLQFIKGAHHLHDEFLQITVEVGIVGLIIFLLFLIYLFISVRNIANIRLKASFLSTMTIMVFSFFTDVPLYNFTIGLFAFVIGYFLSQSERNLDAYEVTL